MSKIWCSCGRDSGEEHKPWCQINHIPHLRNQVAVMGVSGGVSGESQALKELEISFKAQCEEIDRLKEEIEELRASTPPTYARGQDGPCCSDCEAERYEKNGEIYAEAHAAGATEMRDRAADKVREYTCNMDSLVYAIRALPIKEGE